MKKKFFLGILSCMLLAASLTGCGADKADSAATNTEPPAQATVSPDVSKAPSQAAETKSSAAPSAAEAAPDTGATTSPDASNAPSPVAAE